MDKIRKDFTLKTKQLPVTSIILISAAFLSLVYAYLPAIHSLLSQWQSEDNSYCFLVIPLFLYLLWEKKEDFHFNQFNWSIWGLPAALLSTFIIIAGELGSVQTLLFIGLWACVVSFFITLYGIRRVTSLWFSMLILLFIVPMPAFINLTMTFEMKLAASSLSVDMMRAVGISVLQTGNILDLGITKMQVVDACSGLRYLMSLLLMSLLIGHFFVTSLWIKVFLVLLVYPLSILFNAIRIFVTSILLLGGHKSLTEGVFHDIAGIIVFIAAGFVLYFTAKIGMKFTRKKTRKTWTDPGGRHVSLLKSIIITGCFCILFIGNGWLIQNLAAKMYIPERSTFTSFPMEIGKWQGTRNYLSKEILESLGAEDYVNAIFTSQDTANVIYLLIPYYEYQGTGNAAHAPQSCILGGGWEIEQFQTIGMTMPDREIDVGMMVLGKGNQQMLASYFFLQRGRVIVSPWWNKYYLMLDALTMGRTDGALVRVEMYIPAGQNRAEARKMLEDFTVKLWPLLSDYVPN